MLYNIEPRTMPILKSNSLKEIRDDFKETLFCLNDHIW